MSEFRNVPYFSENRLHDRVSRTSHPAGHTRSWGAVWILCAVGMLMAISVTAHATPHPDATSGTELLRDPSFRRGFVLLRPEPGRTVECGTVRGNDGGDPVWQLAQWSSRYPFDAATTITRGDGGQFQLKNQARSVSFGDGVLSLAVNAAVEYGERPRRAEEPWVHLLVEQPIVEQPRLDELATLRLHCEARRVRSELVRTDGYDPRLHAAQFLIFLSVQNLEKGSPGFGDYLWFGVPVYDNRYRTSSTYAAPDTAGSGKYIYTPGSEHYTSASTHEEGWVTFDADLLPLIREGLATARAQGFLKGLEDDGLFRIAAINMGWEVPGTFDVEMQIRRLSLLSTTH